MSDQHVNKWWDLLTERPHLCKGLQRCQRDPRSAFLTEGFGLTLRFFDPNQELSETQLLRLAAAAIVASHIRTNTPNISFPKHLAEIGVKPSVFKRVLDREDPVELVQPLIRLVQRTERKADVHDLFMSIRYWGQKRQEQWARHFYCNLQD